MSGFVKTTRKDSVRRREHQDKHMLHRRTTLMVHGPWSMSHGRNGSEAKEQIRIFLDEEYSDRSMTRSAAMRILKTELGPPRFNLCVCVTLTPDEFLVCKKGKFPTKSAVQLAAHD